MYKIEQHGKISLRRPKLSKEEVKRLMKKKGAPYIYDISSLKVNNLTLILLTWRKW